MPQSLQDVLASQYQGNLEMVKMTLADFGDADLMVRPVPGANHANWQLGHVIVSEATMTGNLALLPAGFAEKYKKETASSDDAKAFASKQELLDTLEKLRAGTVKWVKALTPEAMEQPSPERIRRLAPKIVDLAVLIPMHMVMHVGQFQVIRRKLGKPVLF